MKKIIVLFIAALSFAFASDAQVLDFYQPLGSSLTVDTVTNTATAYVTARAPKNASGNTTIWIAVTKISGTVGGTISLLGSIDGVTYKAINTINSQTALATITATDATNTYHYWIQGNPFPYYRVSWTGTGTMAASFSAKYLTR